MVTTKAKALLHLEPVYKQATQELLSANGTVRALKTASFCFGDQHAVKTESGEIEDLSML